MTDRTFVNLLAGKIELLQLVVAPGNTRATRTTPALGLWQLDRASLVTIIAPMVMEKPARITSRDSLDLPYQGQFAGKTPAEVATIFDEIGPENRFFRLHPAVARWLDATDPVEIIFDYLVI